MWGVGFRGQDLGGKRWIQGARCGVSDVECRVQRLRVVTGPYVYDVYDDVTYVYDDVTCVYDDVTYVYDDVTYVYDDVT